MFTEKEWGKEIKFNNASPPLNTKEAGMLFDKVMDIFVDKGYTRTQCSVVLHEVLSELRNRKCRNTI